MHAIPRIIQGPLAAALAVVAFAPLPVGAQGKADALPPGAIARLGDVRWREPFRDGSGITSLAFSPDGKMLASAADSLRMWVVATGTALPWPEAARAQLVHFSADGKELLTFESGRGMGSRQIVHRWEAKTGKALGETAVGVKKDYASTGARLSGNGKVLLIPSGDRSGFFLWDLTDGKLLRELPLERHWGSTYNISHDGRMVAAADHDGVLCVFDSAGKRVYRLRVDGGAFIPAFSPDGKWLVAAAPRSLIVWEVATGKQVRTIEGCRGLVAFAPGGKLMACGDMRAVRLFALPSFEEVRSLEEHNNYYVNALAFSPDGKRLAAALNYAVAIWDVASGKQLNRPAGHQTPVGVLAFSPDGKALASGDEHGVVAVWDLTKRAVRRRFTGHFTGVRSLAFRPDGKLLATGDGYAQGTTGGQDAYIRLWDLETGRRTGEWLAHLNNVRGLAFTPAAGEKGRWGLASLGGDARLRLWETDSGGRVWQARLSYAHFGSLALSPDRRTVLVANSQGELSLWRADNGEHIRL